MRVSALLAFQLVRTVSQLVLTISSCKFTRNVLVTDVGRFRNDSGEITSARSACFSLFGPDASEARQRLSDMMIHYATHTPQFFSCVEQLAIASTPPHVQPEGFGLLYYPAAYRQA